MVAMYNRLMEEEPYQFIDKTIQRIYELTESEVKDVDHKLLVILPDLRRNLEIQRLTREYWRRGCRTKVVYMRINVDEEAKLRRGWERTESDSSPVECDLDNYHSWDLEFDNNLDGFEHIDQYLDELVIPTLKTILLC